MVTIEPAHIRSTDQAEHVLAVRQFDFHRPTKHQIKPCIQAEQEPKVNAWICISIKRWIKHMTSYKLMCENALDVI